MEKDSTMECISIEQMIEWNTAHNSRLEILESSLIHTQAINFTRKLNAIYRKMLDLGMEMHNLVGNAHVNENYFRAKHFNHIHKDNVFGNKLFTFWNTIQNDFHSHIESLTNLTRWMPYEKSELGLSRDFEEQ